MYIRVPVVCLALLGSLGLAHAAAAQGLVITNARILDVTILTKNAAASALEATQLGTPEPGKLADIVILNGDPLANVTNLLNVTTVIKNGEVVVERR